MTPDELADIHASAMTMPPPWSAPTFAGFLAAPGAVLATREGGFALGRAIADEAELLTLAVAPESRRRGIARACLAAFERQAGQLAAGRCFLEVAASNAAARGLYLSAGYREDGTRRGYYRDAGGQQIDAIVMSKVLASA